MTKDYRCCISCRKLAPRAEFWRIVRSHPANIVTIDRGDLWLQGRSAYLCRNEECWQLAHKKNRLGRSLKTKVDDDIYQQLRL
jgi:uncharacterized protein